MLLDSSATPWNWKSTRPTEKKPFGSSVKAPARNGHMKTTVRLTSYYTGSASDGTETRWTYNLDLGGR
ncbi:hypothetical protein GGP62_003278 [Salinibacter ruber]|nr:hypothetical protein [Salinibacter ruber]MCS3708141.1 hypothetical protein [Salinibacter ruber]MCS3823628.1 hypothetical protein [Salinibacter ruber]MCS3854445.1 hypothetical protein [Salinibacter ruber]MCS4174901.1 hypothetical protein [Salinibacter ruber]